MLEVINVKKEVHEVKELYVYKKIAFMNGHTLSVVNVQERTLDFHVHENSDEMFFVLEGQFELETEEGLTPVGEGEFVIVPKGTLHRPVVKELTRFIMVELDGTLNKENSGDKYED